ncbi:MAG: hypothetical protein PUD16_03120 [bacterium]|nr:hypothetical protein [bacterium]
MHGHPSVTGSIFAVPPGYVVSHTPMDGSVINSRIGMLPFRAHFAFLFTLCRFLQKVKIQAGKTGLCVEIEKLAYFA